MVDQGPAVAPAAGHGSKRRQYAAGQTQAYFGTPGAQTRWAMVDTALQHNKRLSVANSSLQAWRVLGRSLKVLNSPTMTAGQSI